MKVFKIIALVIASVWVLYIGYIYITGVRTTYIVPKGFQGPLLIIANQKGGVKINKHNVIYDY